MPPKMLTSTRFHVRIGKQNAERFGHLFGIRAAADVEEIGRLAAVQLDEIHRAHRQAGAVHQAADRAVELHVAQPGRLGSDFGRLFFGDVAQLESVPDGGTARCRRSSSWHRAPSDRRTWSRPADSFPTGCNLCSTNTRHNDRKNFSAERTLLPFNSNFAASLRT